VPRTIARPAHVRQWPIGTKCVTATGAGPRHAEALSKATKSWGLTNGRPNRCPVVPDADQIFCLRSSRALSTAVGSSAATSGVIPLLLYFVPVTAPVNSWTATASSAPSVMCVGLVAPRQPTLFAPTTVARLLSLSDAV